MITLKPYSGLCNRMRAINSVNSIVAGSEFKIIWENNDALNCDFNKLFVVPGNIKVNYRPYVQNLRAKLNEKTVRGLRKVGLNIPFGFDRYLYDDEILNLKKQNYDFGILNNGKNIYIESQHNFSVCQDYDMFIPVPEIMDIINSISSRFDDNTIGVHIRRGDNKLAINNSPIKLFIEAIENEIKLNDNATFFLSTDEPYVESQLKNKFPQKVITHNKNFSRDSEQGIKDAVVDLWCLSKTSKILGSFWSSFSSTAAIIGKIELKIIKK